MKTPRLPEHESSYWITSTEEPGYPTLEGEVNVDVVVVGGGIAGLNVAYYVKQAGLSVAVIERSTIGAGVSGNTTGKVTSQHNLCYGRLQTRFGTAAAKLYGEANQAAITEIARVVQKEGIDCEWQSADNYVFTQDKGQFGTFKTEAVIAKKLGLPAEFTTTTDLPFAVTAAVRFSGQAAYHTRSYILGLARAVHGDGSYVFENSPARTFHDGRPCRVRTAQGKVTAKFAVMATNVPFPLGVHSYYGAYEYPLKSYIVAGKLPKDRDFKGMYITANQPMRSILPITLRGERWLLIGGESHFPGFGRAKDRHQKLADYAREHFGVTHIEQRWSTWDYLSNDTVPLIGKLYPWSKRAYVATGFSKWGLTTGTVAGQLLRDTIIGKDNPWRRVFEATRFSPVAALPKAAANIFQHLH